MSECDEDYILRPLDTSPFRTTKLPVLFLFYLGGRVTKDLCIEVTYRVGS